MEAGAAATEPLIGDHSFTNGIIEIDGQRNTRYVGTGERHEDDENRVVTSSTFIWLLTCAAGVSGLLFGYDTGVISSTLVSIHTDLSYRTLTTLDKSLITSATSFFALVASPVTGLLADRLGRKRVILLASCLFIIGALWQALSSTVWAMIIGRSIVGLAVGSASFVVPLYIGELSPSQFRGRLVTVASLFITGGQVVAYIVGWSFSATEGGWRWMVGLGALPAAIQLVMLAFMPETPRWLVKARRRDEARVVLTKVYGGADGMEKIVERVLKGVEKEHLAEEKAKMGRSSGGPAKGWGRLLGGSDEMMQLFTVGSNRRALIIACGLQGFQQACGFNSLMYFSATIFALVGYSSPTLTSLSIAVTNFIFTYVAFHSIDRVGRRRILLFSVPLMVAGLVCCAIAFSFLDLQSTATAPVAGSIPRAIAATLADNTTSTSPTIPSLLLLASLILYVSAYALGLGNVPWQQSELFPLSVRSIGSGIATATNWGCNTIVGLTFLPMMDIFTPTWTFMIYALICVATWVSVWCCYPETAGLGLEEVGSLLKDGWGVEESLKAWAGRRRDAEVESEA